MKQNGEFTQELQKIEKNVDNYYKSNPLLKLPFATAAWSFLAFIEDYMLIRVMQADEIQELLSIANELSRELLVNLAPSLWWLFDACKSEGQVPCVFDDNLYEASRDLFELGKNYESFVFAYTCSNRAWIELKVKGSTIQPTEDFFTGMGYEVYNILVDQYESEKVLSSINFESSPIDAIRRSLKVKGDRFRYRLNPKMVSDMITYLEPGFDMMFELPSEWKFSRYTLADFRKVFEAICAIAHIHWNARIMAASQGCDNMGYLDSIYVLDCNELVRRVIRYSGLRDEEVRSIFDDLTYGNRGIKHPNPALQPLIKLNSEYYAIVPSIWRCSAAERNLTALLNKLPSEKKIYRKLASEKETLMKERFTIGLSDKDFRFISGKVTDLPDVDLTIVDDSEKTCLLLELKWFIAPTTARERIEKSEEIEKGISQVLKFKQAFTQDHRLLLNKLQIDSSYHFEGVVVSQNWIGYGNVQSPKVPVIRADHLIEKLKVTESLKSTMEWLKDREYLPKEGEHFEKIDGDTITIGDWSLKSYDIQLLGHNTFFPL